MDNSWPARIERLLIVIQIAQRPDKVLLQDQLCTARYKSIGSAQTGLTKSGQRVFLA